MFPGTCPPLSVPSCLFSIVWVAAALLPAAGVGAATYHIPGDFATIEEAVAVSAHGDSILVGPGSYEPRISMTTDLTIVSTHGAESTTLHGGDHEHRVFESVAGDLTLRGFTIENCGQDGRRIPEAGFQGGAIRVTTFANLLIEDCLFRNNKAGTGGAVSAVGQNLVFRNCVFENNGSGQEYPPIDYNGGSVEIRRFSSALFEDCEFRGGVARDGGAIFTDSSLEIRRCLFEDNFANDEGGAINALTLEGEDAILIEDSTFRENDAGTGGALQLRTYGPKTVRGCDFLNNQGRALGGGLSASLPGAMLVEDCLFEENVAVTQGGGALYVGRISEGVTVRNCYFRSNRCDDYFDSFAGGGALWVIENSPYLGVDIEDCTFVGNRARFGSVAFVQADGGDLARPRFLQCIMAFNEAQEAQSPFSLITCGEPGGIRSSYDITCSLLYGNTPTNELSDSCGEVSSSVVSKEYTDELGDEVFCDSERTSICADSVAGESLCGVMGGLPDCGNCSTPVINHSWSTLKNQYRPEPGERDDDDAAASDTLEP